MCWVSWHSKHVYLLKNHQKQIFNFETLPWQQYYRYQYSLHSFTSAVCWHYSDEVWSKSIKNKMLNSKHLKMTHFLLPVGGAITLTPNSHIYALGIIQRTKPWSLIKIRQCMWMLLGASCLSFFAINSSPRHGQTVRDIKNILAILRPQCLEIMFPEFGGNRVVIFRGVYQIPEHGFLNSPE